MKIQFDPKQQFQLDAVSAALDIFDGQPLEQPEFSVIHQEEDVGLFRGQLRTELGVGNRLTLSDEQLRNNVRAIQERNDIDHAGNEVALESWPILGADGEFIRHAYHYSVEMETGTGKTYVYLRTVFELSRRSGFRSSSSLFRVSRSAKECLRISTSPVSTFARSTTTLSLNPSSTTQNG